MAQTRCFISKLTRHPEISYTPTGKCVGNFRIKDHNGYDVRCVLWEPTDEQIQILHGAIDSQLDISVTGYYGRPKEWTKTDGSKIKLFDFIVQKLTVKHLAGVIHD
jgi:hypothetical protein